MRTRRVLIAGLVLVVLAGGSLAALKLRDRDEEPSMGASETNDRAKPTTAPRRKESSGPIRFVLADRYFAGELTNFEYPGEAIQESLKHLPKVGQGIPLPARD